MQVKADERDHQRLKERLHGLGAALNALSEDDNRAAATRLPMFRVV